LFDSKSNLYNSNYDFVFLFLDGEYLTAERTLEDIISELSHITESFTKNSSGILFISNILLYSHPNKIMNYNGNDNIKQMQIKINEYLNQISENHKNIFIFDLLSLIEKFGYEQIFDKGLWYYAAFRYSSFGIEKIGTLINIYINAANNISKKCLIVDLDNTLWGGVLGEEGCNNICLGKDRIGNIYSKIQKIILDFKNRGIILCICSKNNESDVKEAFEKNSNFILNYNDFVIKKINWEQKDENIKTIAKELNIGEDSCVFVDDSPFERELVKKNTNVTVPEFPTSIDLLVDFWLNIDFEYFSKLKLTEEDKEKTKQYEANLLREELKSGYTDIDDYLRNLLLTLSIKQATVDTIPRLAQLSQKTNQFNFTTIRYTEQQLNTLLKRSDYKIYSLSLKDKFGDYGIIGLIILHENELNYEIENFLLSCRVIGRKLEHIVIYQLKELLKKDFIGIYIPTQKNIILQNKYDELGFVLIEESKDAKKYLLNNFPNISLDIIEVKFEN